MKVLIVLQHDNPLVTGGQIVNRMIYDVLKKMKCNIVYSNSFVCHQNGFVFLVSLLMNVFKMKDYDYIFVDSSAFPKVVWTLIALNILGCRKKIIVTHHHFCSHVVSGFKGVVYRYVEKIFLRMSEKIFVFSPFVYDQMLAMFPKKNMFFVGLPLKKIEQQKQVRQKNDLLYVGTIEERKGLIYLIKALSCLPIDVKEKIKLNVVGKIVSSSYMERLKKEIRLHNLDRNVFFRGRVENDALENFYNKSFAFVFPSLYEGYGMVVVEAMAHSLPVIAFDNTSMPYIIKNGMNGLLVENKNSMAFSQAIVRLMSDEALYKKMAEGAELTGKNAQSRIAFEHSVECALVKCFEDIGK